MLRQKLIINTWLLHTVGFLSLHTLNPLLSFETKRYEYQVTRRDMPEGPRLRAFISEVEIILNMAAYSYIPSWLHLFGFPLFTLRTHIFSALSLIWVKYQIISSASCIMWDRSVICDLFFPLSAAQNVYDSLNLNHKNAIYNTSIYS